MKGLLTIKFGKRSSGRNEPYKSSPLNPNASKITGPRPRESTEELSLTQSGQSFFYNTFDNQGREARPIRQNTAARPNTFTSPLKRKMKGIPLATKSSYISRLEFGDTALLVPYNLKDKVQSNNVEELIKDTKNIAKPFKKTPHIYNFKNVKDIPSVTEEAILVPVRLRIELDDFILKDAFLWNLNETLLTPIKFAEILCNDLGLSTSYISHIEASILGQIEKFREVNQKIKEEKNLFEELEEGIDLRIAITLNFMMGRYQYIDNFDWDPHSEVTPETFAKILAADLGLGGEFVQMISHSIREQIFQFLQHKVEAIPYLQSTRIKKEGYRSEMQTLLKDALTKNSYLEAVGILETETNDETFYRKADQKSMKKYTPSLKYLNLEEMEKALAQEDEKARTLRRRRDGTRRLPNPKRGAYGFGESPVTNSPYVFD